MAASVIANGDDSEDTVAVLTDFYAGLFLVDALVRRLLPLLEGYECKSPEKGKFTLAFRCDAVACVPQCLCERVCMVCIQMCGLVWAAVSSCAQHPILCVPLR